MREGPWGGVACGVVARNGTRVILFTPSKVEFNAIQEFQQTVR